MAIASACPLLEIIEIKIGEAHHIAELISLIKAIGEQAKEAGMLHTLLWSEEWTLAVPGDIFIPVSISHYFLPVSYSFAASAETTCPAVSPNYSTTTPQTIEPWLSKS